MAPLPAVDDDAPWEWEERVVGRSLGVALPARIGPFAVQSTLGMKDGATVYHAVDPGGAGEVTVVVPPVRILAAVGPAGWLAFLDRAGQLVGLRHPGIVPVLDAGVTGLSVYLASAHVAGPTLAERLAEGGRLAPLRAVEVAADLATALAHAHALGIVHRDITPARVRFAPGGAAMLGEFCLDPPSLLAEMGVEATPSYAAPERLAAEPGPFLPASDQYSLGAVLYEMICGRPPYDGPAWRVIDEVRTDEPIPPRDWRPRLSRTLERICLRAMARDPAARYASCQDLARDLRRWARRAGAASDAVGSLRTAALWVRRRPAAALTAALAVVGVVATTTVITFALIASTALAPYNVVAPRRDTTDHSALASNPDRP